MDSRIGLDYIVENKDYTTKLAAGVLGVKNHKIFATNNNFADY